jgi:hypothetical protein
MLDAYLKYDMFFEDVFDASNLVFRLALSELGWFAAAIENRPV